MTHRSVKLFASCLIKQYAAVDSILRDKHSFTSKMRNDAVVNETLRCHRTICASCWNKNPEAGDVIVVYTTERGGKQVPWAHVSLQIVQRSTPANTHTYIASFTGVVELHQRFLWHRYYILYTSLCHITTAMPTGSMLRYGTFRPTMQSVGTTRHRMN